VEEYDGREFVGIDLHRRRSVIVRMTPDGRRIGPAVRINNDPFDLAQQVASWGESPEVVLEATYGWYWAADVLADAGARVHLAHPLGIKGFAYRRVLCRIRHSTRYAARQVMPTTGWAARVGLVRLGGSGWSGRHNHGR
jgi:hypothetical protein